MCVKNKAEDVRLFFSTLSRLLKEKIKNVVKLTRVSSMG